ncbi:zinc finger MYM-type protein 1-like [Gordionus sp. m RMFG-2023]|uniref:zinc finger MYM-type protein 1-like n=2 Tax=Gordionus sp. m RMFG-2023 TaxID=3053472 RepID=UPI0031FC597B
MKNMVIKKIQKEIEFNRCYSIIVDGTYDVSKSEAIALIVRYVENSETPKPVERLIDIYCTGNTTGLDIKENIISKPGSMNLPLEFLVGQSYDGASNMSGRINGVQALIRAEAPKAAFIWCYCHRLNLIVVQLCQSVKELPNVLGILDEIYVYFNGVKRYEVLKTCQSDLLTKSHRFLRIKNTTRSWLTSYKAIVNFFLLYDALRAALANLKDSEDPATSTMASAIVYRIEKFDFILSLCVLDKILLITSLACTKLQTISKDIGFAINQIQLAKDCLINMRNNNTEFLDVFSKAQDFMKKRNLPFDFESSRLQTLQSKKESFKISVFYAALDLIIMQFSERFNDESIKFLSQTSFFTPKGMAEKAIVKDDIKDICEFYQLNTSQVFEEMLMFRNIYKMAKTGDVIITRDLEVKEDLSDSENSSSDDDNNFEMND